MMQLVRYNQPNLFHVAGIIVLKPGYNEVTDRVWAEIKNHPSVKIRLEEEILEVVESKSGDEGTFLVDMPQEKAKKIVHETVDIELLQKWLACDARPLIRNLLTQRLQVLVLPERREAKGVDDASLAGTKKTAKTIPTKTAKAKADVEEPEFTDDDISDDTEKVPSKSATTKRAVKPKRR